MKELLHRPGRPGDGVEGYEADDVIGAMSTLARRAGLEVMVVSGDRDLFQLLDEGITILYTKKGISEVERVTVDWVREKYGLTPSQLVDLKALTGDQSDNVPGVPGIGEKTALRLIREFGGLENLLARLEEVKSPRERELWQPMRNRHCSVRNSLRSCDLALPISIEECRRREADPETLAGFFRRMEFKSLLKRVTAKAVLAKAVSAETVPAGAAPAGGTPPKPVRSSPGWKPRVPAVNPGRIAGVSGRSGEEPVAVQFLGGAGREQERRPIALGVALALAAGRGFPAVCLSPLDRGISRTAQSGWPIRRPRRSPITLNPR